MPGEAVWRLYVLVVVVVGRWVFVSGRSRPLPSLYRQKTLEPVAAALPLFLLWCGASGRLTHAIIAVKLLI